MYNVLVDCVTTGVVYIMYSLLTVSLQVCCMYNALLVDCSCLSLQVCCMYNVLLVDRVTTGVLCI